MCSTNTCILASLKVPLVLEEYVFQKTMFEELRVFSALASKD